jgi:hypothetical protein
MDKDRLPTLSRVRQGLLRTVLLILASGAAPASALPPDVYHSPNDDGVSGGIPATVPPGQPVTLHLYLGVGPVVSTALPCQEGDGDEVCGYLVRLAGSGVALQSFTPADPDIVFNLASPQIDLTGGDFQQGELGPTKLGDLVIDGPAPGGTLDLVVGDFVTTTLAKEQSPTPTTIVTLPEPGMTVSLLLGVALLAGIGTRRIQR